MALLFPVRLRALDAACSLFRTLVCQRCFQINGGKKVPTLYLAFVLLTCSATLASGHLKSSPVSELTDRRASVPTSCSDRVSQFKTHAEAHEADDHLSCLLLVCETLLTFPPIRFQVSLSRSAASSLAMFSSVIPPGDGATTSASSMEALLLLERPSSITHLLVLSWTLTEPDGRRPSLWTMLASYCTPPVSLSS